MKSKLVLFLAACVGTMGAVAGPAAAQAWIGQVAGNMIAAQEEAAHEQACRAGAPAPPKTVTWAQGQIDHTMQNYFALKSTSNPRTLASVFELKAADVRWRDGSGAVPVANLGTRLDQPKYDLTLLGEVVAGDENTARAEWRAVLANGSDQAKPMIYAVDFVLNHNIWVGYSARILHIAVLDAAAAPPPPGPYCHFDPDQTY